MAKGKTCLISNCNKILTGDGRICGKHKWRWTKFGSYDLPGYKGTPSKIEEIILPENIVKVCEIHGNLKSDETYHRYHKGKISSYYCKICILSLNIKNKYQGLNSIECYEKLLEEQNGSCAICRKQNTTTRNGKIKRYAIDHCHKTGDVRGLLCQFCNALLGYSKDSVEILESAISYIKKNKQD